jgi:hypothetical protein
VVSVSLDHTLQVYDLLSSSSALCSVRCPSGLSCVAADAAERRLFLGSTQGSIFLVRGTKQTHPHTRTRAVRETPLRTAFDNDRWAAWSGITHHTFIHSLVGWLAQVDLDVVAMGRTAARASLRVAAGRARQAVSGLSD